MKLKDIEKNLKREHDNAAVPNVYASAKKAPLNKLLTGETPARAFQKHLAMRMLTFVLLLFLAMAIAVSAMWINTGSEAPAADCYISIIIQREGGDTRLGVVMRGECSIVQTVVEMSDGEIQTTPMVSHFSQINGLIEAKSGDKVSICGLSNNSQRARNMVEALSHSIRSIYEGLDYSLDSNTNSSSVRVNMQDYIKACGGNLTGSESVAALIDIYTKLF